MAYDINFGKKGELKLHIRKFLLFPEYWTDVKNHYAYKLKWKHVKFSKSNIAKLPKQKGIYCFVVVPEYPNFFETKYLFYVGQTTRTFYDRYKEYLNDQEGKGKPRPKIHEMLNFFANNLFFYYSELNSKSQIDEVEEKLLNTFIPHINSDIPIAKIKPELKNIYE